MLITGRQLEHWHTGSMTRRASGARLHRAGAGRLGASARSRRRSARKPGDVITIESRRGSISLYARADDGTPRGAVFVPFCYYEAAANLLTNPALDPFGKIPEFKYCAVKRDARRRAAPRARATAAARRSKHRPRLRVPNMMKHVCVAARIGEGKAPGEGNSHSIAKTSNAASRGGRSRFQALYAWMRPRSATRSAPIPRDSRAPSRSHPHEWGPCSTLRCAADSGCNPSGWHEFWPVAPGSRRKDFVFGAETGAVRRIALHGSHVTVPANGPSANESRRRVVERSLA